MTEERKLLKKIFHNALQPSGNLLLSDHYPVRSSIVRQACSLELPVRELTSVTGEPRLVAWDLARTAVVAESGHGNATHPTLFVHTSQPPAAPADAGPTCAELCLALASALDGTPNTCALCATMSGTDGPAAISAGFADGSTRQRGKNMGLDLTTSLENRTAHAFLGKLDDLFHLDVPPSENRLPRLDIVLMLVGTHAPSTDRSVPDASGVHPLYRL